MAIHKVNLECDKIILLSLISNVKNISELKKNVINETLQCGIIKASLIVDTFQLVVAANKAVLSQSLGKMTTKSLYTEVLFNLSTSSNISQSLVKFGIDDFETNVIVIVIGDDSETIHTSMVNAITEINGEHKDFSELTQFTNEKLVKKTYKISEVELTVSTLLDSIVSRIATKDFVSH